MRLHKHKAQHTWEEVLRANVARSSLSLRSLALQHSVYRIALQARRKRYLAAQAAGDEHVITAAGVNNRGGHSRAFSEQQEAVLAAQIKAANPALTLTAIQGVALSLKRSIHITDDGNTLCVYAANASFMRPMAASLTSSAATACPLTSCARGRPRQQLMSNTSNRPPCRSCTMPALLRTHTDRGSC